jgi:hypothetical protein
MELSYFAFVKLQAMSNLNYIFPFFIVEHLQPSVTFYVDNLGFEVRYIGPADDPYWADADGYTLFFGRPKTAPSN